MKRLKLLACVFFKNLMIHSKIHVAVTSIMAAKSYENKTNVHVPVTWCHSKTKSRKGVINTADMINNLFVMIAPPPQQMS